MPNWVSPCASCPRKYRAIGGDGPQPAPILAIAERPGKNENLNGRVLCGNTGEEYDGLYLPLAGLHRGHVRSCNSVLCWADNNRTPRDQETFECASSHLPGEIAATKPEIIILMGATPCSLVPGIKLEMHHGIPQHTRKVGQLFGWSGWLVPMFHPALGLHESRWMKILMDDWHDLGLVLNFGCEDDLPPEPVDYRWARTRQDVADYFVRCGIADPVVDTEWHDGIPWSVQVSAAPGTGILVRTTDKEALEELRFWMDGCSMHNAPVDMEVLRKLGCRTIVNRDTMQEAFHLGDQPQALKTLAYRLFRHTMTSYEETVRPASIRALQEWMLEALVLAQDHLSFVEQRKRSVKVHKGEFESLLTRLLQNTDVNSEYDPWGGPKEPRLDSFWNDPLNEWQVPMIESRIGRYPTLGIANCSMDQAISYAVGDADWTGRVAVRLAELRDKSFPIWLDDCDEWRFV